MRRFIAKLFCAAACAVALFGAPAVRAQDELKIAAIVNDDVITQLDVYMRLRLAMLSAKLQDTPDTRQRMLPTVVRALIEDRLKLQEAKAQGIGVSEPEVNTRIDNLARRNGVTRAEFEAMLESNGVLITALADEIRADIAWARLVQRDLRPKIRITDEEIDEAMARNLAARGKLEYRLSQIFLAVDAPKDEPAVRQSAQRLLEQLQAGADFGSLAIQFSQDTNAQTGGDIGWLRADEVDPAVGRELAQAGDAQTAKGKLIGPVKGNSGIYLDRIEDVRQENETTVEAGSVHMAQLLWPLPPNAADKEIQSAQDQANTYAGKSMTCEELERSADDYASARYRDFGNVPIDAMPPEIKQIALDTQVGSPTKGIKGPGGVAVFVVCDRGDSNGKISRVQIADRLAQARLETLARGYLSDLRRAAYVDIRL